MKLGEYILKVLKDQGRQQIWLADKIQMNNKTLSYKLNNNRITGEELLKISKILWIDLERLKEEF